MASENEIESYRRAYANYTDAQLINVTHEKVPYCADHIAAQQLLAERKSRKEDERHSEIGTRLDELKKPHWSVAPNFWMTLAILVLTAIGATAAVLALLRTR